MQDPEIQDEFIIEAREHLSTAEEDILSLEASDTELDPEVVNRLFRSVHTIKGISGFLNLTKVKDLSHALENIMGKIRDKLLVPDERVSEVLLRGVDRLKLLFEDVTDESHDISEEVQACEAITGSSSGKAMESDSAQGVPVFDITAYGLKKLVKEGQYIFELCVDLNTECEGKQQTLNQLLETLKTVGSLLDVSPELKGEVTPEPDGEGRSLGSFLLSTVIDDAAILTEGLQINPVGVVTYSPDDLKQFLEGKKKPPKPKTAAAVIGKKTDAAPSGKEKKTVSEVSAVKQPQVSANDQKLRIPVTLLNKLMNLTTELVLVRNQNMQAAADRDLQKLIMVSQQLNVITSDLQASVMQTRMCPVGTIFSRFNRLVREVARLLEKEVKLQIIGSEVELDKSIIEAIADPMTHLIRNAVDHGIELPEQRKQAGKNPQGYLELSAFHQEGQVHIQVKDDGKGMDPATLKAKALEKDLITAEEADSMTDREAFSLVFEAGFSTAVQVTDVSGRGVGMDVVKSSFQKLGGSIDIASELGMGTTITIKLPLTLAIMPALIVAVENNCYAIPQVNITEVVWLHGEEVYQAINQVDDKEIYWLRGKPLPFIRLSRLLDIQKTYHDPFTLKKMNDRRAQSPDRRKEGDIENEVLERRKGPAERRSSIENYLNIIVVKVGNERMGLAVDKVIDTEELVVKPLHEQLKECGAFAGTAVLGDSRIAMILDIAAIADLSALSVANIASRIPQHQTSKDEVQTLLLFNIGGKEQFALPLCLITRVQEIHRREIQVANKRDYLNYRGQLIPLIRLESVIPTFQASYGDDCVYVIIPKCRKPIGIMVSSVLDTMEVKCQFESCKIDQPGIIGSQLINGRLTLFLDTYSIIEKAEPEWLSDQIKGQTYSMNVLLVEDSVFYQSLLASYLRGFGISLMIASDGAEALALLEKHSFDSVISDIEMPGMDGYELARTIRKQKGLTNLPLLAISAVEEAVVKPLALDSGFNEFKSKLIPEELLETLKRFVNVH